MRIKVPGTGSPAFPRPTVAVYDEYFGNGYFHGCSMQACVTDNDLDTSLPGVQGKTNSDGAVGTTTIQDLSVTAGTAYYLVVKSGGSTITNGGFTLEMTWKDPDDWAGCTEDTYDGKDAWFAFTTAATLANGGSYTIETENSTADTAIALYKDTGDNTYQAGEFQTCANEVNGSASITTTLQPSTTYYVRVKQPIRRSVLRQRPARRAQQLGRAEQRSGRALVLRQRLVVRLREAGRDARPRHLLRRLARRPKHVALHRQLPHQLPRQHQLPVAATQQGCSTLSSGSTNSMDAVLQSGKNYYVLVKGNGAGGNSGTYGLSVVDSGIRCGDELQRHQRRRAPRRMPTKRSPSAARRTSPST